jgi:hypothetical protein
VSDAAPLYCAFYCEENVWHLCAHARVAAAERRVLFVSNADRRVAMWGQRAAATRGHGIAWDYHVVLLLRHSGQRWQIWDLDAHDPGPRSATGWLRESFEPTELLPRRYAPRFRMVESADYRRHLRSDRRHMLLSDGTLMQPPPPWQPIVGEPPACAPEDGGSNLARFVDTQDPGFLGQLFDLESLGRWLQSQADGRA